MNPLEWLSNKFGKAQPPKLPRSQQELLDFRNFKNNEVLTQVNKDAAAGAKAMKGVKGKGAALNVPSIAKGLTKAKIPNALSVPAAVLGVTEAVISSTDTDWGKSIRDYRAEQDADMEALTSNPMGVIFGGVDMPSQRRPMASFGPDYKEQEAALAVAAERSRGRYSSSLPASAATPGEGPKGNEVGSDADPDTPGLQGPGAPITPVTPGRPSEVDGGISTAATVALDLEAANGLLSRGSDSENPNRFLAEGTQMADINSFLPATIPVSGNEKPSAPVDQAEPTALGGDEVAEGVVTQQKPTTISPDGADNTRSVSVPGEPEGPVNYMEPQKSADAFLRARREAFLNPNNRGYGAIRAADAAVGRFRQGDKFFYNDAGTMREVDEQTWRKGQHQAINPVDEMDKESKFMEGWKDSKIKPTLVPTEQTDITNPDSDGGQNPAVSDFNENNIGPVADGDVYGEHLKRAREKTKK